MINSELIDQLLEKLKEQTIQLNLNWISIPRYFETTKNEPLRRYIIDNNKYAYSDGKLSNKIPLISEYRSQLICLREGVIIIFNYNNLSGKHLALAVQVNTSSSPTIVECSAEQLEKLDQLYDLVKDNQYDLSQYIKSIIDSL